MIIDDLGIVEEPSGSRHHRVVVLCESCNKKRETRYSRAVEKENHICSSCKTIKRNTTHGLYYHPLKGVYNTMK